MPFKTYLSLMICVMISAALATDGSVNFSLPVKSAWYFAGPAVRA